MEATSKGKRTLLAVTTGAAGMLLAWLSHEPASLLISVAAAWMCFGWLAGLTAVAVTSLLFAAILSLPAPALLSPIAMDESTVRIAVFVLSAFGLWVLLQTFRSVNFFDQVYRVNQPTNEDIPGLGWSTYPDGRMRFVNPAALISSVSAPRKCAGLAEEDLHSWWRHFVHPDDIDRSIERWAYSLRNAGEPLVDERRVRRHDGPPIDGFPRFRGGLA